MTRLRADAPQLAAGSFTFQRTAIIGSVFLVIAFFVAASFAQDRRPQEFTTQDGAISVYQPQIESYKGDRIKGRAALSILNKDAEEPVFGMLWFSGRAITARDTRTVEFKNIEVERVKIPQSTSEQEKRLAEMLTRESAKWMATQMPLEHLLAITAALEKGKAQANRLNMKPPKIIFTTTPSALILINGKPELRKVENSAFERVINTPFLILFDPGRKTYYTKGGDFWYSASNVMGPWVNLKNPPAPVVEVTGRIMEPREKADKDQPKPSAPPRIIVATEPTELIVSEGRPKFAPVQDTELLYMSNTPSEVFMEVRNQQYYVLLAGRWYQTRSLEKGPWTYVASENLPQDFKRIPPGSSKGHILAFVAGTEEAGEAALDAQIPQITAVKRNEAQLSVAYDGDPKFEPIKGTNMEYAVNTKTQVIKVNNKYYAVDEGVWFVSDSPTGPWVVADDVPPEIETIPPDSPVYNVKYVRVYDSTPEVVYDGYTPGYRGSYVYGDTIVYGTGYTYPGWLGTVYYPAPITWGFAPIYDPFYYSWGFGWGYGAGFVSGFFWGFPLGIIVSPWWYGCYWAGWYPWYGDSHGYPLRYGYWRGWHGGYRHYPYHGHYNKHPGRHYPRNRHIHASINRPINIKRPVHGPAGLRRGTGPAPNVRRPGQNIHPRPGRDLHQRQQNLGRDAKPPRDPRQGQRPPSSSYQRHENRTRNPVPHRESRPGQDLKRPVEVPRTSDRDNRRQESKVFSGRDGNANLRVQQGGEQRSQSGPTRPGIRPQPPENSDRYRSSPGRVYGAPMRGTERGSDSGRVTGGYSGRGTGGQGSRGGGFGSFGRGSPSGGSFRSAPRLGGGTPMSGGFRGGGSRGGGSRR